MVLIIRVDYRGIYCKKIYNDILGIAYREHLMTL